MEQILAARKCRDTVTVSRYRDIEIQDSGDIEIQDNGDIEIQDSYCVEIYIYYGGLRPPISSSCGELVAFGHIEGPTGPPLVDGIILRKV